MSARWRTAFSVGVGIFALAGAPALACKFTPATTPTPIEMGAWTDATDLAFRIGVDWYSKAGRSTLLARLERFGAFDAFRRAAGAWGGVHARTDGLDRMLAEKRSTIDTLRRLCRTFDDASFDETPIDLTAWSRSVAAARVEIENAVRAADPLIADLKAYSGMFNAAASHYSARKYPANAQLKIGPPLSNGSRMVGMLYARLRAIRADLQFAADQLRFTPDLKSEAPVTGLTTAMISLDKAIKAAWGVMARAPGGDRIRHILRGGILYDSCPVVEGKWGYLQNGWSKWQSGVLTIGDEKLRVLPKDGHDNPVLKGLARTNPDFFRRIQTFRFSRIGNGWWKIETAAKPAYLLDVLNSSKKKYSLRASPSKNGEPKYTGQEWRCIPEGGGQFRLANRFLGEAKSIDTYNNNPETIMADTGAFGAQYWRFVVQ